MVLVGGLLLTAVPTHAGDAKDTDKKVVKETPPPPPWPRPLDLTIVGKDNAQVTQTENQVKFINDKLEAQWKAEKVVPSRYADDYEFIRRASLNVIGRIATPEEIKTFLKDPEKKRRSMLIERLLSSEDYPRHWANLWSNWMLTRSGAFGRGEYHDEMNLWLEDQFASNVPYDKIVEAVLTAQGDNVKHPEVNFLLAHVGLKVSGKGDPDLVRTDGHFEMTPLTSRITKLFLGTQIQCAQCHDHPFYNNIKQKDFWGVNAFLRQVDREGTPPDPTMGKRMGKPGPLTLVDDASVNVDGMVYFEKRNGVVQKTRASFLPGADDVRGGLVDKDGKVLQGLDRRKALADYVINHPMFPKEYANRMWGVFFGKGFVNPVDDFNDQNQPSNADLLNGLADSIKNYGYDQKAMIRWICNSNAYNLSCVANSTNDSPDKDVLFSRMLLKAMSPEQLFDSLMTATKAEAGESKQGRKDAKAKWLDTLIGSFGDDEGNEVNFNGTIVQALLMMNGGDINDAISREDKGTVALLMKEHHISNGANDNPFGDDPRSVPDDPQPRAEPEGNRDDRGQDAARPSPAGGGGSDETGAEISGFAVGAGQQQRVPAEPLRGTNDRGERRGQAPIGTKLRRQVRVLQQLSGAGLLAAAGLRPDSPQLPPQLFQQALQRDGLVQLVQQPQREPPHRRPLLRRAASLQRPPVQKRRPQHHDHPQDLRQHLGQQPIPRAPVAERPAQLLLAPLEQKLDLPAAPVDDPQLPRRQPLRRYVRRQHQPVAQRQLPFPRLAALLAPRVLPQLLPTPPGHLRRATPGRPPARQALAPHQPRRAVERRLRQARPPRRQRLPAAGDRHADARGHAADPEAVPVRRPTPGVEKARGGQVQRPFGQVGGRRGQRRVGGHGRLAAHGQQLPAQQFPANQDLPARPSRLRVRTAVPPIAVGQVGRPGHDAAVLDHDGGEATQ